MFPRLTHLYKGLTPGERGGVIGGMTIAQLMVYCEEAKEIMAEQSGCPMLGNGKR
jgi:hypothetical protein